MKSRDLGKARLWLAGGLVRAGAGMWLGKCEGKRPMGRTGLRRGDKIKMCLEDVELEGVGLDQSGSG